LDNLLVMKFGGTSMGSASRIKVAAGISAARKAEGPVVVVVSAMSKVTDLLLETLRKCEAGDRTAMDANLDQLAERHIAALRELVPSTRQAEVTQAIESLVAEFRRIAGGMLMLGERPPRSVDEGVAVGERLSALLLSAHLESEGVPAVAVNAREVIVTDAVFGNATPIMDPTRERAAHVLGPLLAAGRLPVVTGFNGATADGRPTTLGRGGSDFSASILAAALDAAELWIWTDVDGIMSADPRLAPDAIVLPEVTYAEAAELAYNGAKVLHPRTLAPLVEKQIPVWSKNSFAPDKPGTRIIASADAAKGPRAVTSMSNVSLVSLESASSEIPGTRLLARATDAIAAAGAELLALTSSSYRQSFCFLVRKDELQRTVEALESTLSLEIAHGYIHPITVDEEVGLLAIVGEGMRGTPGLAGRIFTAISRDNVNIIAIAQGASELTIAIVVRRDGLEKAVRAVHSEFMAHRP
jgi:bifunctional aspartokinase / homoserine dehydrogenase 1